MKEKRVIPITAWVFAGLIFALSLCGMAFLILSTEHSYGAAPAIAVMALIFPAYTLLVGYVHGDAKRRGMRYVMWTWLAILVPNGIGIILYFILRDPLQSYCVKCGEAVRQGFGYCPKCGTSIAPSCPQCHKIVQAGWTHCPYCGAGL